MGFKKISELEEQQHPVLVDLECCGVPQMYLVHAGTFPVYCGRCEKQLSGMFAHLGSRYGYVGTVECEFCSSPIYLIDHDYANYEMFLNPEPWPVLDSSARQVRFVVDFAVLYRLSEQDLKLVRDATKYDMFTPDKSLSVDTLTKRCCATAGIPHASLGRYQASHDPRFQRLPAEVETWLALLYRLELPIQGQLRQPQES